MSVLLSANLIFTLFMPQTVYAKTDYSDPAGSLEVYLVNDDGAELIYDYQYSDIQALADGEYVSYSSIDAYPVCVYTLASGVFLDTLIEDAKERSPDITFGDWSKIKLYATDEWVSTYTKDFLYDEERYYFPNLFTTWDVEYQEPGDGADGNPERSKPMFAIDSFQTRIFDNSDPLSDISDYKNQMNRNEAFRFCIGMTEKDLISKASTTAKYGRWVERMDIIVSSGSSKEKPYTSVTGLNLNMETAEVKEGNTVQLTATIIPDDATNKNVNWSSDDNKIAKVSKDGLVTGVSTGKTTITAVAADNAKVKKTCAVIVTDNHVDVTGIALDDSSITLTVGKTKRISPIIRPYNATNTGVTWKSDNTAIATVDANGLISAKAPGNTKITVKTDESGFTDSCNVKVVADEVLVTKIKLDSSSFNLKIGETKKLNVSIIPSDATNSKILWSTDKVSVATVDTTGLVTAKGEGKAIIRAMTEDKSISDFCTVTVIKENETTAGTVPTAVLNDIANSWAKDNIEKMVEFGAINGYQDGSFKPNETITRAEFVTMIVKTLQKLNQVHFDFDIVFEDTAGSWARDYISIAASHGFVEGYSDFIFGPDDEITREQVAAVIVRAFDLPAVAAPTGFVDEASISPWAKDVVAAVAGNKVMSGTTGNRFAPKDKATRAEAATVLLRVLELKEQI